MQNLAQRRAAAPWAAEMETPAPDNRPSQTPAARPRSSSEPSPLIATSTARALIRSFENLGVEQAFGVSGGSIALLFDAIVESSIRLHHLRHETGAAFAATEAYFASRKPTLVFATTGPGLLNALTGITAAQWDGAKVILVSGYTSSPQRGRWATQETSSYTMPQDVLYSKGPLFDYATRMEHAAELPEVIRRLSNGLVRQGGFVAHVAVPMSVLSSHVESPSRRPTVIASAPTVSPHDVEECVHLLKEQPFAIWAGFGATEAAPQVRRLAERTGAKVMVSPRAKGILPEDHPQYLGVTGLGGHESVIEYMIQGKPRWVLVLGTRLGEATSFWDLDMVPSGGFIHVDLDSDIPGTAYPEAFTLGIQAEIGLFLEALVPHFDPSHPMHPPFTRTTDRPWDRPEPVRWTHSQGPVRPQVLMHALQRHVIDDSDALILSECGNAFAWCNHYLCFPKAGRYRVSTLYGSMGHATTGVVGAAIARRGKAVAVVGDGSMLMSSELSTAAQYGVPAVWVVLNDAGYGMCRDGHRTLGLTDQHVDFPRVEFAALARSQGADGALVEREDEIDAALEKAMAAPGPFVVDVRIDPEQASPLLKRFESLIRQGSGKNVAGWET